MNWKYLFERTRLDRGRRYYIDGRVTLREESEGLYVANVFGSRIYRVEVRTKGDRVTSLSCNCPDGAAGHRCKHIAAVLYAIDAKEMGKTETNVLKESGPVSDDREVRPFAEEPVQYRYFDLHLILGNLVVSEKQMKRAQTMIETGKIRLLRMETEYQGREEQVLVIYGEIGGGKRFPDLVKIVLGSDEVKEHSCQSFSCYRRIHPFRYMDENSTERISYCDHELALLLLARERIERENPGDATNEDGGRFLELFTNRVTTVSSASASGKKVRLEPRLEISDGRILLSFRIGFNKLYVVRNLNQLILAVRRGETITLGTSQEISFASTVFDERSQEFYDMLEEMLEETAAKPGGAYYDSYSETRKVVTLQGPFLDRFFELVLGNTVETSFVNEQGEAEKTALSFADGELPLQLQIHRLKKGDRFDGITLTGKMPEIYRGSRYGYYRNQKQLLRISEHRRKELSLLAEFVRDGQISLTIGRKYLASFYRDVLPDLEKVAQITEEDPEETAAFLPPAATFSFFVDGEEDTASCRAVVHYGANEFRITKGENEWSEIRDERKESQVKDVLNEYFTGFDAENGLFLAEGEEALSELVQEGLSRLMEIGEVQATDRFRKIRIRRNLPVSVGVSLENDLMNLEFVSEDTDLFELQLILEAYRRKKKFYRLHTGDLMDLSAPEVEELSQVLEAMMLQPEEITQGQMKIPMYRALYLDKMLEQSQSIYGKRDARFRKLVKDFKTVNEADFEVPQGLGSPLRKYQRYGYRWLRTLEMLGFGGILADEMGLGKTIQMISVVLAAREEGRPHHTLVTCPASLTYNWQEEFARFAPVLTTVVVAGTQAEREEILVNHEKFEILITSYDMLRRDIKLYDPITFDYQVIDEAQYIKNHGTAAAKSVKIIHSNHRFALTGTPIENRLSELWSIFDYLMPGFLYEYHVFREELETPIAKNHDEDASLRLQRMVRPFILRRRKKEVLADLPEKLEETRYAKMEKNQQDVYDAQVLRMREMLEGSSDAEYQSNKIQILAELTRIRQICCDPSLLFENYRGGSAKREACLELIQSAVEGDHKILVFSQFVSMLEMLEEDLKQALIPYYKITGQTKSSDRLAMVKDFNKDDTPVFLISLRAGGTGLNLTGADVVIHYDPWWNLAVQNQATDRAHRIGQTKEVSVYKLIIKGSIEEKILDMQEKKKDLAEEILSGEGGSLMQMSKDELLELLV
ncbi:MAG: SNF2 helicase associated domain-containing protein [Lachnospiraceae bacterium]|nr:SNF2 helicase associated domain-containing protein [Lachnospiraceae bacterium]